MGGFDSPLGAVPDRSFLACADLGLSQRIVQIQKCQHSGNGESGPVAHCWVSGVQYEHPDVVERHRDYGFLGVFGHYSVYGQPDQMGFWRIFPDGKRPSFLWNSPGPW